MDATLLAFFTNVAGPWGLVGILLFFEFFRLRKDDKSIRESLDIQIKSFEMMLTSLNRIESSFITHDARVVAMFGMVSGISDKMRDLDTIKAVIPIMDRIKEVVPLIEAKFREGGAR